MDHFDSIVIGGGHNGLVCAAYLARKGHRTLILEQASEPGGLAAAREFHPGFRCPVAHSISHFSTKIARELELSKHGFELNSAPLTTFGAAEGRKPVILQGNSLGGASEQDQAAYGKYTHLMGRFARALRPFWEKTIPRIGNNSLSELLTFGRMGLNIRRLGKTDMREFLRIVSLPARDLMDEYFQDDLLKAVLSWDGLLGAKMAPRSPNSAVLALLYRMSEAADGRPVHRRNVPRLSAALESAAAAAGAEVRCSAGVRRVLIEGDANGLLARGVELDDGEVIRADRVISSADPFTTFIRLVGARHLDIGFTNRIRRLRCEGFVGKLHLALNGPPEFTDIGTPDARIIVAPGLDDIELAFDDAKYGECSGNPLLEVTVPSLSDDSLAPAGQHVLSAHVMYIPANRKGGWTAEARDAACESAIGALARIAPGIRDRIVHREFLTPADIESRFGVTGGHWHHAEFSMEQMLMMRPTYEAAQYGTPIPGLFLCGAGTHPGGDLTGMPGHNAAAEILR